MRRALDLGQDTNAILDEIRKTLHVEVRKQVGTFLWVEAGELVPAKGGGLTVLQALCERERATVFNQTNDEPPPFFVEAIQDFMIVRNGRTSTRSVRKTARNAWRDDPGADRRIREREPLSPGEAFRSPYLGQPEKYDPGVILAFARAIARASGRPRIFWTCGKGKPNDRGIPDHANRGVMLDVLVAAVEWAMCVAWKCAAPSGSKPPKVKAEGILRIIKADAALTNSTD
jgi:hypothetical protein